MAKKQTPPAAADNGASEAQQPDTEIVAATQDETITEDVPEDPAAADNGASEATDALPPVSTGINQVDVTLTVDPPSLVVSTSSSMSSNSGETPDPNAGTVAVVIDYPETFTGTRHFKNGSLANMAPETAAKLVAAGIAKYPEAEG